MKKPRTKRKKASVRERFESIDSIVSRHERDPARKKALDDARQTLMNHTPRQRGALMMYVALAAGVVILVLGLALRAEKSSHKATKAEYAAFVSNVKTIGEAAEKAAALKTAADKKSKEKADVENKRTTDNLRITIARLRDANPSRSVLPSAPSGSSRPDLICLDRAEYQREDGVAIAKLFAGARGLADESSENTVDLNTAKLWAQESR